MCDVGEHVVGSDSGDAVCRLSSRTEFNASTHCAKCTDCGQGRLMNTSGVYCDGNTFSDVHAGGENCMACNQCPQGQFRTGGCNDTHPAPICQVCPACECGMPVVEQCSGTLDRIDQTCAELEQCPNGFFRADGACNCTACRSCQEGFYWTTTCDGTTSTDVQFDSCRACNGCDPTFFIETPCSGTFPPAQQPCLFKTNLQK